MTVQRVAVIGAGAMGHGIAQVAAMAGLAVSIFDSQPGQVDRAITRIKDNLDKGVERGKVAPDVRAIALANLRSSPSLRECVEEVDLVIEAAPEVLEAKLDIFWAADQHAPVRAILATNTSSLSISRIAEATNRRDRVVGLHFFNPVHIMALLEIVRGRETSPATIETALDFARDIGKEPIVVSDTPGFASSRLGVVLGLEAMRMLEEGVASAAEIDRAMELGYNHPMGPLRLTDLVGLDVRLNIAEYLHAQLGGDQYRPPAILRELVTAGRLGKKSGHGFYDWPNSKP